MDTGPGGMEACRLAGLVNSYIACLLRWIYRTRQLDQLDCGCLLLRCSHAILGRMTRIPLWIVAGAAASVAVLILVLLFVGSYR